MRGFSALQRAENSSIRRQTDCRVNNVIVSVLFSEPKIPQYLVALKRRQYELWFQCSSASRKFLNRQRDCYIIPVLRGFSSLQRAENSSIASERPRCRRRRTKVSVLFSEPKIPQYQRNRNRHSDKLFVSVLFSEPKIPQYNTLEAGRYGIYVSVLFSEPKIPQ